MQRGVNQRLLIDARRHLRRIQHRAQLLDALGHPRCGQQQQAHLPLLLPQQILLRGRPHRPINRFSSTLPRLHPQLLRFVPGKQRILALRQRHFRLPLRLLLRLLGALLRAQRAHRHHARRHAAREDEPHHQHRQQLGQPPRPRRVSAGRPRILQLQLGRHRQDARLEADFAPVAPLVALPAVEQQAVGVVLHHPLQRAVLQPRVLLRVLQVLLHKLAQVVVHGGVAQVGKVQLPAGAEVDGGQRVEQVGHRAQRERPAGGELHALKVVQRGAVGRLGLPGSGRPAHHGEQVPCALVQHDHHERLVVLHRVRQLLQAVERQQVVLVDEAHHLGAVLNGLVNLPLPWHRPLGVQVQKVCPEDEARAALPSGLCERGEHVELALLARCVSAAPAVRQENLVADLVAGADGGEALQDIAPSLGELPLPELLHKRRGVRPRRQVHVGSGAHGVVLADSGGRGVGIDARW
mmetsp:Transcript_43064/g.111664  ORF Transcript_43064/g.111664 Transcript_43064/m.111664 type:complete len:465 (-) Transcript_43064:546-1940(-)